MWFVKSWAVAIKCLIITGKRQFLTCYRHLLRRADPQENRFHTRPVLHGRHPLISFLQASLPTFHPFLYGHSWDPLVGLSTFQACPTGPPWFQRTSSPHLNPGRPVNHYPLLLDRVYPRSPPGTLIGHCRCLILSVGRAGRAHRGEVGGP